MSHSVKKRWTVLGGVVGSGATVAVVVILGVGAGAGAAATAVVPQNTSPPTITGTAQEGQKLVGHRGTWSGNPTDYNDFWVRCDKDGGSCANISGATNRNGYLLKSVDVGNTIRFKVKAINADGSSTDSSVPTAVVTAATTPPPSNGCAKTGGTIPVASVSPPAHLTYSTTSLTGRFQVSACGGSVEGALVYVTAVPFGQFAIPNEQPTGLDGWATLQFTSLSGFPASSKQQLLVMFVRARKSGEDVLGGISARRLVSFHVTHG